MGTLCVESFQVLDSAAVSIFYVLKNRLFNCKLREDPISHVFVFPLKKYTILTFRARPDCLNLHLVVMLQSQ